MDFRQKETLRMTRVFLLENVIFEELCDHLIVKDIFSEYMLEHIQSGSENSEKIRRMLDYLAKRPSDCFQKFLEALDDSNHEHCRKHLEEVWVRSGPTQISSQDQQFQVQNRGELNESTQASIANPSSGDIPTGSYLSLKAQASGSQVINGSGASPAIGLPEILAPAAPGLPVQESSSYSAYTSNQATSTMQSSPSTESSHARGSATSGSIQISSEEDHTCRLSVYEQNWRKNEEEHGIFYDEYNMYRMNTNPRGLALLINNEEFEELSSREGSSRDVENLHKLFKSIGFEICHEKNKKTTEMRALLKTFAKYDRLATVDSLVVVILSHGGRDGVIYGKDGSRSHSSRCITDEEIQEIFSAKNCPAMAGKPKLIILQACRGNNEDVSSSPIPSGPLPCHQAEGAIRRDGRDGPGSSLSSSLASSSSSRIAKMADMCLIHSTVGGYVSYRHTGEGSPFINMMTSVFTQKAAYEHLTDMMVEVKQRLSQRPMPLKRQDSMVHVHTVPSSTDTLTRKWFLNPFHLH